jgi:hypothetical protein
MEDETMFKDRKDTYSKQVNFDEIEMELTEN